MVAACQRNVGVLLGVLLLGPLWAGPAPAQPQLNSETRIAFTRRVQPILFNRCASQACHGRHDALAMPLRVPFRFGQLTPLMTEHNLEQVLRFVNLEKPQESLLLQRALQAHGNSNSPPLPGPSAPAFATLETWVLELAGKKATPSNGQKPTMPPTDIRPVASNTQAAPRATGLPPSPIPAPTVPGSIPASLLAGGANPGAVSPVGHGSSPGPLLRPGGAAIPGVINRGVEKPVRSTGLGNFVLPGGIVSSSAFSPSGPATPWTNQLVPGNDKTTSAAQPGLQPAWPSSVGIGSPNLQNPGLANQHNLPPNPFATSSGIVTKPAPSGGPSKPVSVPCGSADPFDPNLFNQLVFPPRR